jgi:hypothetical protein
MLFSFIFVRIIDISWPDESSDLLPADKCGDHLQCSLSYCCLENENLLKSIALKKTPNIYSTPLYLWRVTSAWLSCNKQPRAPHLNILLLYLLKENEYYYHLLQHQQNLLNAAIHLIKVFHEIIRLRLRMIVANNNWPNFKLKTEGGDKLHTISHAYQGDQIKNSKFRNYFFKIRNKSEWAIFCKLIGIMQRY